MDYRTGTLLFNTLLLSGAVCAISLPLGTFLAWVLARTDLPGRKPGGVLLAVLLFVPLYLQAAAWQAGFGLQGWFTLAHSVPFWLDGWTAAIWVHSLAALPWVVLIVGAGFLLVEPELEEQALQDGSATQVFFHVTLPGVLPAIGIAALWVAITTAGEMTVTDLFVVRTYAEELYTQMAIGREPGVAALGVLPGVLLTAGLVAAALLLVARLAKADRPLSLRGRRPFRLGRWRLPVGLLVAGAVLLLVGVPLVSLCYKAGVVVTVEESGRLRSWSPWKTLETVVLSFQRERREFGWSMAIGVLSATSATVVAVLLAWPARRGRLAALPALLATAGCLAVPGPVVGLCVIWLLNRPDCSTLAFLYDCSILAPLMALTVRALPLATLILWHAFRTLPPELMDAAACDGAGRLGRLVRIAIPCRASALALAWLVALAVALGDLAASVLVVPPGVETLSIRIFGLLHYGVEDRVAGVCLAMVGLFALAAAAAIYLVTRRLGKQTP